MDIRAFILGCVGCLSMTFIFSIPPARFSIDPSVDPSTARVIEQTWTDFREFSSARAGCFAPPVVRVRSELENRGSYCPATGVITLRVPRDERGLRESLIHELAHHVEFSCPEHLEVRAPFTAAGPLPSSTWTGGQDWSRIPSERFAEATIELIYGARLPCEGVTLTEAELEVARAWWDGEARLPVMASVAEVTVPGENEGDTVFIGGGDNLLVTYGAARFDDR